MRTWPRRRICPRPIIWAMCRGRKTRPPSRGTRGSSRGRRSARCSTTRCPVSHRRQATPISTFDPPPRSRRRSRQSRARRASTPSALRGRTRSRSRRSGCARSSTPARTAIWSGWRRTPRGAAIRARCGRRRARSSCSASITGRELDPLAILKDANARRHLGLCPRRRLPRRDQVAAQGARPLADRYTPAATSRFSSTPRR